MAKSLKDYFEKAEVKSYLNCKINKEIYDQMFLYKKKLNKSWPEVIEALFMKILEEENKVRQK